MDNFDYDMLEGLAEVEEMYDELCFEDPYEDIEEPEIPQVDVPEESLSSPAPKKNVKKTEKKQPQKENKGKKTPSKPAPEDKKDEEQKKDDSKKPEESSELDDLVLDKEGTSKESEPITYVFDEDEESVVEVEPELVEEDAEANKEEVSEEEKEAPESPQVELEEEVETEVIPPSNEPEIKPEEAENKNIYTEPYEEVIDVEKVKEKGAELKDKYAPMLTKAVAFAAMILVIIGIPVFLSSLGNRDRNTKTEKVQKVEAGATTTSDNSDYYDTVGTNSYKSLEMTNHSSRFETLDDLSFYLESNINATLSKEQALYNTYCSGNCSKSYYTYNLNEYIDFTDEMSHLLTANKALYKEEGKEDTYNYLSDALDVLMVYGDTIR